MRQTGVLAAAGIYALDHNIDRLKDDHNRAKTLAEQLATIKGLRIDLDQVETNMLFIHFGDDDKSISDEALGHLKSFMAERDCRISPGRRMRCVIHRDLDDQDCAKLASALAEFIDHYAD